MGCFASTERGAAAPTAAPRPTSRGSSTSEAAVTTTRNYGRGTTTGRNRGGAAPVGGNPPLTRPKLWRSTSRVWTPRKLERERTIFFETRVSGSADAWAVIRAATEMVRNSRAGSDGTDASNDGTGAAAGATTAAVEPSNEALEGAKAVLEAAGLSVPTGRLTDGVWDDRGRLYKLPKWIISDPQNVTPDEDDDDDDDDEDEDEIEAHPQGADGTLLDKKDLLSSEDDENGALGLVVREKGKEKATAVTATETIRVHARLSSGAADVYVDMPKTATVRAINRRLTARALIDKNTKIKCAYSGRLLKERETLIDQGWQVGHTVSAFIVDR